MRTPSLGRLALLGACAAATLAADARITARINELLARPAARRAFWGIAVRDLATGSAVYERNAGKLFLPASNAKLFSTALALSRLGPDYRFATQLTHSGRLDDDGTLWGDLHLVGGGDPNLSARILPYRWENDFSPDLLKPLRPLARKAYEAGIRRVRGNVVGDDSRYVWQPYPAGWSHADTLHKYGSPVSALVFNDNRINVWVRPGRPETPARLRVSPALPYYAIANRTVTLPGRLVSRRLVPRWGDPAGQIVIAGQIPVRSRGRGFELAADDPARFAALAFRQALADIGITVDGKAVSRHFLPDRLESLRSGPEAPETDSRDEPLATASSASLREAVRVVNKASLNLQAEMLLRETGLREARLGSREAGLASLRLFLAEAGLQPTEFVLMDGSGLSRRNLIAPTATVQLLAHMWNSSHREAFVESLPVAGRDGTLDWRFRRSAARGRILAKTGSMSHVLALSGYAINEGGPTYAFAIFANNFGLASSSTQELVDLVAAALIRPAAP